MRLCVLLLLLILWMKYFPENCAIVNVEWHLVFGSNCQLFQIFIRRVSIDGSMVPFTSNENLNNEHDDIDIKHLRYFLVSEEFLIRILDGNSTERHSWGSALACDVRWNARNKSQFHRTINSKVTHGYWLYNITTWRHTDPIALNMIYRHSFATIVQSNLTCEGIEHCVFISNIGRKRIWRQYGGTRIMLEPFTQNIRSSNVQRREFAEQVCVWCVLTSDIWHDKCYWTSTTWISRDTRIQTGEILVSCSKLISVSVVYRTLIDPCVYSFPYFTHLNFNSFSHKWFT